MTEKTTKETKRRKPEPTEAVTARSKARHKRLIASGGRQVAIRLDADASASLSELERRTGLSPRSIFSRMLSHPDIEALLLDLAPPREESPEPAKPARRGSAKKSAR